MARNFGLPTNKGEEMPETTAAVTVPETITLTKEQFETLLQGRSTAPEGLSAKDLAEAFAATQKRENPSAPMISAYNPKGDNVTPRPRLRCKTTQNGVVLDHDTLMWEEIVALNLLPAGEFMVTKSNGQRIRFAVQYTRGFDGEKLERVDLSFPSKDEHKYDHRGLFEYCLEVMDSAGMGEDVANLKALQKELNALRKF